MTTPLAIALYFVIWWTTLFAVLPFGLKTQGESGDVVPGTPASAPTRPHLLRLFAINTAVAAVVYGFVLLVIFQGWLTPYLLPEGFNAAPN